MGDAIWEHKKGRVWVIVREQEREIAALRYQNRLLQVRLRKALDETQLPHIRDRCG